MPINKRKNERICAVIVMWNLRSMSVDPGMATIAIIHTLTRQTHIDNAIAAGEIFIPGEYKKEKVRG